MPDFFVNFWSSIDEYSNTHLAGFSSKQMQGLKFGTLINGGYGNGSFSIALSNDKAQYYYTTLLGAHSVIFDYKGIRLYEGFVDDVSLKGDELQVKLVGYYALGKDTYLNFSYTAPTISEIVSDCVDLCPTWDDALALITTTTVALPDQDYLEQEEPINTVIERLLPMGYGEGTDIRPIYFALWRQRMASLFPEPFINVRAPTWFLESRNITSPGVTYSRSSKDLIIKLRVAYDIPEKDPPEEGVEYGPTYTSYYQDTLSQSIYGVREGVINIGTAEDIDAEIVGELSIKKLAWPEQKQKITIEGFVRNGSGGFDYPYMIKAGDIIQNLDVELLDMGPISGAYSAFWAYQGFITKTDYDCDRNVITIDIGTKAWSLDQYIQRLGLDYSGAGS